MRKLTGDQRTVPQGPNYTPNLKQCLGFILRSQGKGSPTNSVRFAHAPNVKNDGVKTLTASVVAKRAVNQSLPRRSSEPNLRNAAAIANSRLSNGTPRSRLSTVSPTKTNIDPRPIPVPTLRRRSSEPNMKASYKAPVPLNKAKDDIQVTQRAPNNKEKELEESRKLIEKLAKENQILKEDLKHARLQTSYFQKRALDAKNVANDLADELDAMFDVFKHMVPEKVIQNVYKKVSDGKSEKELDKDDGTFDFENFAFEDILSNEDDEFNPSELGMSAGEYREAEDNTYLFLKAFNNAQISVQALKQLNPGVVKEDIYLKTFESYFP
ncbi:hypothetical protein ROZALSC1DRAFT_29675, partial [Rozella allomycis CSF55]